MKKEEYIEKYGGEKYKEHLLSRRNYNRTYREKNKEKVDEYNRQYFQNHKEELKIKNRKNTKKYYEKHNAEILQKSSEKRFANHEECLKKERIHYAKNKDKINARKRERRKRIDVKEKEYAYGKIYREINREKLNKNGREFHKEHSEYYSNHHKKYYDSHKEQIKKKSKEWQKNNKDKIKKYDARRHAKRKLYGFNIIAHPQKNKFLSPMIWHHLSDEDVIQIPEWIHIRFSGFKKEKHRELILKSIRNFLNEEYYVTVDRDKYNFYRAIDG